MSETPSFSLQDPITIPGKLQEMLAQSSGGGTCGSRMYGGNYGGRKSRKSRGKKSCKSRGKKSCKSRGKKSCKSRGKK